MRFKSFPASLPIVLLFTSVHATLPSRGAAQEDPRVTGHGLPTNFSAHPDGHVMLFSAYDQFQGAELWRYDGSTPTRVPHAGINQGVDGKNPSAGSFPREIVWEPGASRACFTAEQADLGRVVWRYDQNPESDATLLSHSVHGRQRFLDPRSLTMARTGTPPATDLYFVARTAANGEELMRIDLTPPSGNAIPATVFDIHAGTGNSSPTSLLAVDGVLWFSATDATARRLMRIRAGDTSPTVVELGGAHLSFPSDLVLVNDGANRWVYFIAGDRRTLYRVRADGSADAELVQHQNQHQNQHLIHASQLVAGDGMFAIVARWSNVEGRRLVKWVPEQDPTVFDEPRNAGEIRNLTHSNGEFWFSCPTHRANGDELGREPWRTTGDWAISDDLNVGKPGSFPTWITPWGSSVVFRADTLAHGAEPHYWNAHPDVDAGRILDDIATGMTPAKRQQGSRASEFVVMQGGLLFAADDGDSGMELWGATKDGAYLVHDFDPRPTKVPHVDVRILSAEFSVGLKFLEGAESHQLQLRKGALDEWSDWSNPRLGSTGSKQWVGIPQAEFSKFRIRDGSSKTTVLEAELAPRRFALAPSEDRWACNDRTFSGSTPEVGVNPIHVTVEENGSGEPGKGGCVDDRSGEYRIVVKRTDNLEPSKSAWLLLTRFIYKSGARQPLGGLSPIQIEPDGTMELRGRADFKLPRDSDEKADQIEVWVFEGYPDPSQLPVSEDPDKPGEPGVLRTKGDDPKGVLVYRSYC